MALPRFAAFKSSHNGKYLNCVPADDKTIPNYVQYGSDEITTAYTKFSIEAASTGKDLFHIRSIYNQKYLKVESTSEQWITATAVEANEEQSDWACTLFQFAYSSIGGAYEIIHVHYGRPVDLSNDLASRPNCLYIYSDSGSRENHAVLDWEMMVLFPQHVVFKGDNGKYLKIHNQDYLDFLRFFETDPHVSSVQHEVFVTSDGKLRIKGPNNKFWRAAPNWILVDSTDETSNDSYTLFQPYKISKNVVSLHNLGANNFCKRLTADWKEDCLHANDSSMSKYTRMTVEEAIISREVYNVRYRLSEGRIYGETIIAMDFQGAVNYSSATSTMTLEFTYTEEASQNWSANLATELSYSMSFEAGIPFILESHIEISAQFKGSYTWGETRTKSKVLGDTHNIDVLPGTSVKVGLIATKGYCDVPFSYTRRDVLLNGEVRITEHDDGLFTGANSYNFHYDAGDVKHLPTT